MSSQQVPLRPLRWWWVACAALLVIGVGAAVGWWLWAQSGGLPAAELARARTDAIRTGLTAAGGTGAALALLLAVRRQRATEVGLRLQDAELAQREAAAAAVENDAAERRITELYLKAVEQLGSEKAPVRLGALHALERLGQDNPPHRQTVVNVICAYLRMPYWPVPAALEPELSTDEQQELLRREQERQVRQTAQGILRDHLRPEQRADAFWPGMDLDLTGAYLIDFNVAHSRIGVFSAIGATFAGETGFHGSEIDLFLVQGARFIADARTRFHADFRGARFTGDAWLASTVFEGTPWFHGDHFLPAAVFAGTADFTDAEFRSGARFDGTVFTGTVSFDGATAHAGPRQQSLWPDGWEQQADGRLVRVTPAR